MYTPTPFSRPLVARKQHRPVFAGPLLRTGTPRAPRLEGLPPLLDLARAFLLCRDLPRADACFRRVLARCALHPRARDPMVFAAACVGLARTLVAGANDWLALPHTAETVLALLTRGINAAGERGAAAQRVLLGEALGCLGVLLEAMPGIMDETPAVSSADASATSSPSSSSSSAPRPAGSPSHAQMRDRIVATYVTAIACCAGGLADATTQHDHDNTNNAATSAESDAFWQENAVNDMLRIGGDAARTIARGVPNTGPRASRDTVATLAATYRPLARQVARVAAARFGPRSTAVAQSLCDLGRIELAAVAGVADPVERQRSAALARSFFEDARHAYAAAGRWAQGATEMAQCALGLVDAEAHAGRDGGMGTEGARDMARAAASKAVHDLRHAGAWADPAEAAGASRVLGAYGRVATRSGDVLGAVDAQFCAKEAMGGPARRIGGGATVARRELNRQSAGVWGRSASGRLSTWSSP